VVVDEVTWEWAAWFELVEQPARKTMSTIARKDRFGAAGAWVLMWA
jgi:hypothetical protein